jgi:hypothetical protein
MVWLGLTEQAYLPGFGCPYGTAMTSHPTLTAQILKPISHFPSRVSRKIAQANSGITRYWLAMYLFQKKTCMSFGLRYCHGFGFQMDSGSAD